ncbi:MAG: hypothetical protein IH971_03665 [Candidatus Marinimicrobia bacterium]|nr:hypothetical protein [Candidatus Neomarinimicrobiota bacterium]
MINLGRPTKLVALGLVLIWGLVLVTPARANIIFFTTIMRNCQHYRVSADMVQMNLEKNENGELVFYLTLPSRRNNFEEVILVGYVATSHAIARTGLNVIDIYVAAVSRTDDVQMTTRAKTTLAEKLRQGEIKTHEFMRQIEWVE